MFRSKRSALVKRLLRQRIVDEASCSVEDEYDLAFKSVVPSMLKRLKEVQLEALVIAVESRGAEESGCVLVPNGDLRLGRRIVAPNVLCCQLWRWPDLKPHHELKKLHTCKTVDALYICCNPYHWSRLCKPDSPPPPYSRHTQEQLKCEVNLDAISQETGGTNNYGSFYSQISGCSVDQAAFQPWCNIAYWELSARVGRLFPVVQSAVNVFSNLPHSDGLCLETLAQTRQTDNSSVIQTRKKIGFGVTVCREDNEVWVYNRSEYPIFVNSPTLDPPNTHTLTVYKVPPGYSIKIFDFDRAQHNKRMLDPSLMQDGPFDPYAVRISFAKGWGTRYSRQFVTSCPCWLELIFRVNR